MLATNAGDGKVAVYRWFENGEGWAYHPWFSPRGLELSRALDAVLKGAKAGAFCVPALGGYLVGEQREDDACPDAKACARRPMILTAAFLPRRPRAIDQARVVDALHHLDLPLRRREDAELSLAGEFCEQLEYDANDVPAPSESRRPTPPHRRTRLPVGLLLALLGMLGLFAVGALGTMWFLLHPQVATNKDHASVPPERMQSPRKAASVAPVEESGLRLEMLTAGRFRQALGAYAQVDHPYTAYLRAQAERLPESAAVYHDRAALRKLLPELMRGVSPEADLASDDALVDVIVAEILYERWREGAGRREFADADKPLPDELRRFVERFRRPTAGLRRTAVQMAELLQTWGEREPSPRFAAQQPLIVIDRFFAFLTRPRFTPRPLAFDHPKVAFLWRLPADPVGEGQTFDREADVARALRILLYHLDPQSNPHEESDSTSNLLRRIAASLRYDDWLNGPARRTYVDAAKDPGAEVDAIVARFAR